MSDGRIQAAAGLRGGVPRPAGRDVRSRAAARRLGPARQTRKDQRAAEETEHGPAGEAAGREESNRTPRTFGKQLQMLVK